jgi:hypothetical protein
MRVSPLQRGTSLFTELPRRNGIALALVAVLVVAVLTAVPALAAPKFERQCATQGGQFDEGPEKNPKDDSCLVTTHRSTVNSVGNTVTFDEVTRLRPDGSSEVVSRTATSCTSWRGFPLSPSGGGCYIDNI